MLTFNSENARMEALKAIPEMDDAPPNIDLDEYRIKIEKDIDDINSAQIVSNDVKEENIIVNATKTEPNLSQNNNYLELLRQSNEQHSREREEIESKHLERMKEFEDKISKLEEVKQAEIKPKTSTDHEILAIQEEIDELEEEMNDEDADVYDEEYIKNLKKHGTLNSKLNRILFQNHKEQTRINQVESDNLKKEQKLKMERLQKEETHQKVIKKIEDFRANKPEFSGKLYHEMDQDYIDFSREVASIWYGKTKESITNAESELAIDKYLSSTPALIEAMKTRKLTEPKDMRKFITLSEINATRMGYRLNKTTGSWEQMKDEYGNNITFPDHDAAYNYIKGSVRGKDLFDAQNKTAKGVIDAITKRSNPVELNIDHTGDNKHDMTREEAHNVLSRFDEEQVEIKRRKNFNDPMVIEYNKALVTLGHTPLTED